jgi:hypothetical protein
MVDIMHYEKKDEETEERNPFRLCGMWKRKSDKIYVYFMRHQTK